MSIGGKRGQLSDHASLNITLAIDHIQQTPRQAYTRWNLAKADWDRFKQEATIAALPAFEECQALADSEQDKQRAVDRMVELLNGALEFAGEEAIGKCTVNSSNKAWWYRYPRLIESLERYYTAKRRAFRKGTEECIQKASEAHREWQSKLAEANQERWERQSRKIAQNPSAVNWKAFHSIQRPATVPIMSITNQAGQRPCSEKEALNSLAKFFAEVCTAQEVKLLPAREEEIRVTKQSAALSSSPTLDKVFTLEELKQALSQMRNSSAGPDSIPAVFLKHSPEAMLQVILFICNYSWKNGIVPTQWREANIVPIFKAGSADRTQCTSYRPISLTSVICKLMEKMALERLWKEVGHRLNRLQFGFRGNYSTLDALLHLQRRIHQAFKSNKHLSVVFLDISKAFDRTWHDGLLFKLANIGIVGNAWRWCKAFLSDRKIRTVHDSHHSDWFDINAGVPQGSVLSPFLFLVYINDVFDAHPELASRVELALFADDIAVVPRQPGSVGDDKLVPALISLENWCKKWQMEFNVKKSKLLCFSKKRIKPEIRTQWLLDGPIERVKTFDYLGLRWQENAQWKAHMDKVFKSARRASFMICSLLNQISPKITAIRTLCHALIRSRLAYGMPVWSAPTEACWRKMDVLVTGPMRRCLRLPNSTFLQSVLVETKTLPMKLLYESLAVATAARAHHLHQNHPTKELIEEQLAEPAVAKCRTPLLARAVQITIERGIDTEVITNRRALYREFLVYHRNEWRNSGQGKLLVSLTPARLDSERKLQLPLYFHSDSQRSAVVRAKLRFDRSNLKETLLRQTIIADAKQAICQSCDQGVLEDVKHVLFFCPKFDQARDVALHRAHNAGLRLNQQNLLHWTLGDFDEIKPFSLRVLACTISSEFLLVVNSVRPF